MWKYQNVRMLKCVNGKMGKCQSVKCQNVECENVEVWKCWNVKMLKCENFEMWKCLNAKMSKCDNVKMWKCSNVKIFKCETSQFDLFVWWMWNLSVRFVCVMNVKPLS